MSAPETYPAPAHGWTCFHCGETFHSPGGARDHFGFDPAATPACLLTRDHVQSELRRFRWIEGELRPIVDRLHSLRELLDGAPWDGEETPAMLAQARLTLAAEGCVQDDDFTPPVVAPGRMADFQREWRRRPGLRALIRAAQDLDDALVERNRSLCALREMARSAQWRREPGGRLPVDEFFGLAP